MTREEHTEREIKGERARKWGKKKKQAAKSKTRVSHSSQRRQDE